MTKTKKRSSARFALGMLTYALVFIAVLFVGLRLLWGYMDDYEKSLPSYAMDAYMDTLDDEHLKQLNADFIDSLDPLLHSREENLEVIKQNIGQLHYARKIAECDDKTNVYILSNSERDIGRVVLTSEGSPALGLAKWTVAEESMDMSWLVRSAEITIPADWKLFCGENELDSKYITEKDIEYDFLKEFYTKSELSVPTKVQYSLENYIGDVELTVTNPQGEKMELSSDGNNDELFTNNCTAEEKAAVDAFLNEFVSAYVSFLSNTNSNAWGNYAVLKPYLVEGSDLDNRARSAIDGLVYASSRGDTVTELTVNRYIKTEDGQYIVDYVYVVDTIGQQGHVSTTNKYKLLLTDTGDGLKASLQYSY